MNTVLYVLCTVIKKISLIALNFVPIGANKILDQLSIPNNKRQYEHFNDVLCPGALFFLNQKVCSQD